MESSMTKLLTFTFYNSKRKKKPFCLDLSSQPLQIKSRKQRRGIWRPPIIWKRTLFLLLLMHLIIGMGLATRMKIFKFSIQLKKGKKVTMKISKKSKKFWILERENMEMILQLWMCHNKMIELVVESFFVIFVSVFCKTKKLITTFNNNLTEKKYYNTLIIWINNLFIFLFFFFFRFEICLFYLEFIY